MTKARFITNRILFFLDGRFEAHIKVYEVGRSFKFPDGFKVRCALIEKESGVLRILLDNHEPYGYHLHTKLPEDKNFRVTIEVKNYSEAISIFIKEIRKVLKNET
jgi:hypothetical protein